MRQQVLDCFNIYKESLFRIDNDLLFWRHFLKTSIDNFPDSEERKINTAIFCAYDHQHDKIGGRLKSHQKVYSINSSELESKRIDFFNWIMNLSILKSYNALEILILQAIQIVYYPLMPDPILGKKQTDKIQFEVKKFIKDNFVTVSTKNNEHLIRFLTMKSVKLKSFMNLPMNIDIQTKWIDFFFLISILRNVIAHCGMVVQPEIHNEIKSRARDIFERYFVIVKNENGLPTLYPREEIFGNFINNINSLSISIYKFIFNENDLSFIEME